MADEHEIERTELEAVLETRRELGASYDAALVESFADRIEAAVLARTASDLGTRSREARDRAAAGPRQLTLGIVSCAAGIPVTAISLAVEGGATGLAAMIVGWGGLVAVNFAHAFQARPRS